MNCRTINITNSSFSNLISQQGGAIYIEENKNNKLSDDSYGKYFISRSNISNATAKVGGAIYISNTQYLTIDSCNLINNTVYNSSDATLNSSAGSGGAIYYTCDAVNLNCQVDIIGQTRFINNYASIKGGALHWDIVEPIFGNNIFYLNNSAAEYGNNISCFAQRLAVISRQQYLDHMKHMGFLPQNATRRVLDDNTEQPQIDVATVVMDQRSGDTIPDTYLAHVDKYNQIVGSDSTSKVQVLVDATYSANDSASLVYSPTIEGTSQFLTVGGTVLIQNVAFSGSPGYNYSIFFTTNGIDQTKVSNKEYMANINSTDISFDMYVDLRECLVGEQFTTAGKCVSCPNGTSYSLVQMTSPGSCASCPTDKAVCYGGTNVGPKPGYWRSSNTSDDFIACLYAPACLGMIPPENNPQGSCYTGYQGILCADCAAGFSRGSNYKCSKCPTVLMNGLRLTAIFILVIGLLVLLIWSTLSGAKNKRNVTSIYTKILMNHIQLILLTASFNFNWPEQVVQFFSVAEPVAEITTQIFSFDCFLQSGVTAVTNVNTTSTGIRIIFQKEVMIAALPILMAICSFVFWYCFMCCCKKKGKMDILSRVISTLVILLFLAHPNIVQMLFYNFKCYDVDGVARLMDDLQVICWSQWHKVFSYFVAIPGIIVWGLGIPFFGFILLTRVKNRLDTIQVREKLGFLYRGYKYQFYYFEIVIMYRKITLIFIAVFISAYGVIAQALIVFMILILFLIISAKKKPFSTIALNDLEILSLVTSMLTVYCGLFFITDTPETWITEIPELSERSLVLSSPTKLFFFFVIVTVNLVFFAYWSYKMYLEMLNKIRKSIPKIYTFFCLCNSREKFQQEIAKQKIREENEHLHEEFTVMIKNIKKLQADGRLILTENIIERLAVYLDQDRILDAAGANNKINKEIAEKLNKRYERIKESNFKYQQVNSKIEGGKNQVIPFDSSLLDETQVNRTTELNDPYHKYENTGGKMNLPLQKDWLKVDVDTLGEFNEVRQPQSRDAQMRSTFASQNTSDNLNIKTYLKGEFNKQGRHFGLEPSQTYRSSDTDQIFSQRQQEEEKGMGLDELEGQIFEEHYQVEEDAEKMKELETKFVNKINKRMALAAQRQGGEAVDIVIEKRKENNFKKAKKLRADILKQKNERIQQKIKETKGIDNSKPIDTKKPSKQGKGNVTPKQEGQEGFEDDDIEIKEQPNLDTKMGNTQDKMMIPSNEDEDSFASDQEE